MMKIGEREFNFDATVHVMGVLNVTPDSFSDGGRYLDPEVALERALVMEAEGAALIDLGAESSRPGAIPVSEVEERRRLFPVLRKLVGRIRLPISIDTRRAGIAEEAIGEGASLINDISACRSDPRMAEVIAGRGVPCILMHMRGEPATMQQDVTYLSVVAEVVRFLREQIERVVDVGVSRSQLLVDPGFGFGKELPHNLEILARLEKFKVLECPIVVGLSRKSMIRRILGTDDPTSPEVREGSVAAAIIAALKGASLIRTHDVLGTVQALRLVEALREVPLESCRHKG